MDHIRMNSATSSARRYFSMIDCYLPPAPHAGKVTRALVSNPVITFP
jgi:hypothetical protein